MINDVTEHAEDERTSRRIQYGVRLTHTDGSVLHRIEQSKDAARRLCKLHKDLREFEPNWRVTTATLISRTITVTLGPWGVAE